MLFWKVLQADVLYDFCYDNCLGSKVFSPNFGDDKRFLEINLCKATFDFMLKLVCREFMHVKHYCYMCLLSGS